MKIEDITSVLVFCCRSNQGNFSFFLFFLVGFYPSNSFVQVDVNLCKCTKLLHLFLVRNIHIQMDQIGIISYILPVISFMQQRTIFFFR
ncbi:hypothetical protein RchiOBHm_Chr6g0273801 [Rosa chinensis]|uniref:Uncharacterized protein n=1 Tax=Rosa chinensis TaxID=74649 RepID=A0A2P6PRM2_ROSCH|nr:hypothetical protein RchiOBHm_Chr6g0273801 [Rosa chinensis]